MCLCSGAPECVLSAKCCNNNALQHSAAADGSAGLAAERGDSTTQRESSSGESVQGGRGGGGASQNQKPHLDTPPVSPLSAPCLIWRYLTTCGVRWSQPCPHPSIPSIRDLHTLYLRGSSLQECQNSKIESFALLTPEPRAFNCPESPTS